MGMLDLRDARFSARICSDTNRSGFTVSDICLINLGQMVWIEGNENARRLSFQLDADRWLEVVFDDVAGFAKAYGGALEAGLGDSR
ncbi:MAG: hypothetical protein AAF674_07685 [Pseudomonadota bacterium]